MEEKDVVKLIDDRLDEKLKPINEGLKALLPSKEEAAKGEKEEEESKEDKVKKKEEKEEEGQTPEEGAEEEEEDAEKDALKAENISLKETLEKLQSIKKGLSKAAHGQEDEEETQKPYSTKDHLRDLDRDSMGRAIKKKE